MDEIFRMLGKEHEADLEREALKWRRAAAARRSSSAPEGKHLRKQERLAAKRALTHSVPNPRV
jgi:hypothetical protein